MAIVSLDIKAFQLLDNYSMARTRQRGNLSCFPVVWIRIQCGIASIGGKMKMNQLESLHLRSHHALSVARLIQMYVQYTGLGVWCHSSIS